MQIVINGGYKTFLQIHETLFPNGGQGKRPTMPLVVVGDSGGAAKWIARKCELFDEHLNEEASHEELNQEIRSSLSTEEKAIYVIKCLKEIVSKKRRYVRFLNIFKELVLQLSSQCTSVFASSTSDLIMSKIVGLASL